MQKLQDLQKQAIQIIGKIWNKIIYFWKILKAIEDRRQTKEDKKNYIESKSKELQKILCNLWEKELSKNWFEKWEAEILDKTFNK